VVVFAGHRIDGAGEPRRFPPGAEAKVRAAIVARLRAVNAGFGFSAAANGAEPLFQEAMRDAAIDGETFVVLPYSRDEFVETSVDGAPGGEWRQRFEAVLARATEPAIATGERSVDTGLLFEYAHTLLLGFAALQARAVDAPVIPMVLWDGKPDPMRTGPGGAAAAWRKAGHSVEVIDIAAVVGARD
jgi:hypothetical protein